MRARLEYLRVPEALQAVSTSLVAPGTGGRQQRRTAAGRGGEAAGRAGQGSEGQWGRGRWPTPAWPLMGSRAGRERAGPGQAEARGYQGTLRQPRVAPPLAPLPLLPRPASGVARGRGRAPGGAPRGGPGLVALLPRARRTCWAARLASPRLGSARRRSAEPCPQPPRPGWTRRAPPRSGGTAAAPADTQVRAWSRIVPRTSSLLRRIGGKGGCRRGSARARSGCRMPPAQGCEVAGGRCGAPDRGGVCAPGKARRRARSGCVTFPLGSGRSLHRGARRRQCSIHTPQFSGSPVSRSRPGATPGTGGPGGSLRPWDSSAWAALGYRAGPVLDCGSVGGAELRQGCSQHSRAVRAAPPRAPGALGSAIAPREEALRWKFGFQSPRARRMSS